MAIQLNINSDISLKMKCRNVDNQEFETSVPGRFDPNNATNEDIEELAELLNGFTTNVIINKWLTAKIPLEEE